MHIIIGIIGIATAAYFLIMRARNGAEMATELMDVAQDVASAARRFGFRRRQNVHPVDSIEEMNVAIGALGTAFIALDDLPTQEGRAQLDVALRKHLNLDGPAAQELEILGQWLVEQCSGPVPAIPRLAKRAHAIGGADAFTPLMQVIQTAATPPLSTRQTEALDDIKRGFRLQ